MWEKLIEQVPSAAAVIVMALMFLRTLEKLEATRSANAKQLADDRRAHEIEINNTWARFIKQIAEEQNAGLKTLVNQIQQHEERSQRRYERMNVTAKKRSRNART